MSCRILILVLSLVILFFHWGDCSVGIKQFPSFTVDGFILGRNFFIYSVILFIILTALYGYIERKSPEVIFPSFCESSIQRAWNDLMFWLLLIAIGCTLCNYSPFGIETHREWSFKLWKIVAIIMSLALGILYYLDMYFKFQRIIEIDFHVYPSKKVRVPALILPAIFALICLLLLVVSLVSVILLPIKYTLFFLIICTSLFIAIDFIINNNFKEAKKELLAQKCIIAAACKKPVLVDVIDEISESDIFQKSTNNRATLTDKGYNIYNDIKNEENVCSVLNEVDHIINNYHSSLLYGNIPGMIGFCTLILVVLLDKQPNAVSGFIAGGTAMHMIFGNIVVAVGLRKFKQIKFYQTD